PRPDELEVAQKQLLFLALAVFLRDPEQEARVDGDPAFAAIGERQRLAAIAADCHDLAEQAPRRGRAQRDGDRRANQLPLMLDPPAAGGDLAPVRLVVDAPLAALHALEMLERVGDVARAVSD